MGGEVKGRGDVKGSSGEVEGEGRWREGGRGGGREGEVEGGVK